MFFKKYEVNQFLSFFNWRFQNKDLFRGKKIFLKLNVLPVRGTLITIAFNFFEQSESFFQNSLKNKNFLMFNFILQKWLVLKKNKIFF